MSRITWDDQIYSVGIRKMDEEHKQLIALINALDARKNDADAEFINKVLNTLVLYTQSHFRDEEKILKKIRYQALDAHMRQHSRFVSTLNEVIAQFKRDGNSKETLEKLITFLSEWITRHILVEDKAYGEYLLA